MSWQKRSLGKCCSFSSGGTPNKGKAEYWNGEIPWVSSGEMGRQFIGDTTLHISEEGAQAGSRLVSAGTIFAVVRGMSLATEFRVSYATRAMAFNQDVKAIVANDGVDSYFLFAALRAHATEIRDLATEAAHGTKKLEMERLEGFQIGVPGMDVQLRIANAVRAYDDLIETNRRRIALLEESARLLYREWFVTLRFPGAVIKRNRLPDGWTTCSLGDLITLSYGKSLTESKRVAGDVPVYGSSGIVGTHNRALVDGPALIVGRKGNVGSVFYSEKPCFPIDTVYFVEGTQATFYNYLLLQSQTYVSSDTAVPGLNRTYAYSLPVLRSSDEAMQQFEQAASPLFKQASNFAQQNACLQAARDALLPKLMSGEIQV